MSALEYWAEQLRAWAIPGEILDRAPESPYTFPPECFRRRTGSALAADPSASGLAALEALPENGTVLDVGVGAGAASLPLASRAALVVGVDRSQSLLDAFLEEAEGVGVEARAVLGEWPDVAGSVGAADVVVCHHVLYNVGDLAPFVSALSRHARRRVVVEITDRHPWSWMNDLWARFHDLGRPDGPTADDAAAALRELDVPAMRNDSVEPRTTAGSEAKQDAVALVRRRLCLMPDRDPQIEEALGDRLAELGGGWSAGPPVQRIVTFWWDTPAG